MGSTPVGCTKLTIIMKLILASKSPRRKDILNKAGFSFEILDANFPEVDVALHPIETAVNNALGKARSAFKAVYSNDSVVLGADTVVYFNDTLLGKPTDENHARLMLKTLSGIVHSVVTGYAIVYKDKEITGYSQSKVTFNKLSKALIESYVQSGSPMDKAGAYGIQDDFPIVKSYDGSLSNIIGLPIEEIKPILNKILKDDTK